MERSEQSYNNYKIPVPIAFENVFSHFYIAENRTCQSITKTLLPSYQTIMVFSFGATPSLISQQGTKIEIEKCLVLGPIKQALLYTLPVNAEILVANFKDDAFYRFFGNAILSDHLPIHPDELLEENCFTDLWFALQKMDNSKERVEFILEFCKPYLRNPNTTSQLLSTGTNEVLSPIKEIAEKTGQSERNIQLHQKKHFGYSAKEKNRYIRFIKAVETVQRIASSSSKADWFEVIEQCGYYDQSQLIHDFRHFLNLSPTKFLKFQQEICQAKPE
ncbi:DNA-binding protein [Niastella koreensis]|uniref:Helix-turn-helix domain-containing protein AraC type n=2 Tax=Niastella koreensis TaxID=354356 RepID=G8TE55_NIAKG|nr:AraC family transcriptional regulator [Niastella koreensis]AEV97246.1 helix-turn-helix domain-containing protein AraC type [Niastella koreensis GR20-10]OQP39078.1 DNA-binding protein [Niastella koreensis]